MMSLNLVKIFTGPRMSSITASVISPLGLVGQGAQAPGQEAVQRIDALAKYRLRHLSDPANRRSHCFVRLLEQIPKCSFSVDLVESRTRPLIQELRAHHLVPGQNYELEVIPYEVLWDLVCQALMLKKAA